MAVRTILIHPDPKLKKICAPFEGVDGAVRKLADDMLETMYDAPGVGLAAPQIGVLSRMFVMDCSAKDDTPEPRVFINPEVVWTSDETNVYNEGCLSLPEMYEDIERPAQATVRYLDVDGGTQEETFEGLWATCAQHEIDHLQGKLFIDYLSGLKRSMITKKMLKLKKDMARG